MKLRLSAMLDKSDRLSTGKTQLYWSFIEAEWVAKIQDQGIDGRARTREQAVKNLLKKLERDANG